MPPFRMTYFNRAFSRHDTEHYHWGINFVTPPQAPQGLRRNLVKERRVKAFSRRCRRKERNQTKVGVVKEEKMLANNLPLAYPNPLVGR